VSLQLRASREAQEPRNALDMMDVVWEVGAADEKDKRAMDLSESPSAVRLLHVCVCVRVCAYFVACVCLCVCVFVCVCV